MRRRLLIFSILEVSLGSFGRAQAPNSEHVAGRLLVQRRLGASASRTAQAFARFGARVQREIPQIRVSAVQVPEPAAAAISAALMRTGLFTYVEPDGVAHSGQTTVNPNDPQFLSQWHLATIQAPSGWSVTTGAGSVTIAVIDSGVEPTHPDLVSKLVPGWNFLTGTSNAADDLGHGTAVAGTAAAATDNALGVAGVSWGNTIMPLVVLDSSDYASYSNIASAITYAADHGIRIMNISIGGSSPSSTLQSAVNYAWNKGAVIFASAMNFSTSTPYYPAACTNVIAVSATDSNDTLASFSDYGSWIDLSAPGNNILTTQTGASYGYWYGTSFSAPIAAATAALVLSRNPSLSNSALVSLLESNSDTLPVGSAGWNQYFGWGRVNVYKALLAVSSPPAADTTPPTVAISSPVSGATVAGAMQILGSATDNVGVTSIQFSVDNQAVASATVSPFCFSWNTTSVGNGTHTLTVTASDAAGNAEAASVSVSVNNAVVTDTQPPIATITSPSNGARMTTKNVQISVSATDNVGVTQMSIYVDNVLQCTDMTAPYTCTWNTRKAASGSHVITANAWDAAGNLGSATPITVYK